MTTRGKKGKGSAMRAATHTTQNTADGGARGAGELVPCVSLEDIMQAASEIAGVSSRAIVGVGSGSCADLTRVRHVVWYVAMENFRFSGSGVRRLFFKDVSTIHRGRDRILRELLSSNRTKALVRAVRFRAEEIAGARIAAAIAGEGAGRQDEREPSA